MNEVLQSRYRSPLIQQPCYFTSRLSLCVSTLATLLEIKLLAFADTTSVNYKKNVDMLLYFTLYTRNPAACFFHFRTSQYFLFVFCFSCERVSSFVEPKTGLLCEELDIHTLYPCATPLIHSGAELAGTCFSTPPHLLQCLAKAPGTRRKQNILYEIKTKGCLHLWCKRYLKFEFSVT